MLRELLAQMDPLVLTVPLEQSAWNQWLEYRATGATGAAGKYCNYMTYQSFGPPRYTIFSVNLIIIIFVSFKKS